MKCLTLLSRFFRILKPDTRRMGRFSDVVMGVISVMHFIKYLTYLFFQFGLSQMPHSTFYCQLVQIQQQNFYYQLVWILLLARVDSVQQLICTIGVDRAVNLYNIIGVDSITVSWCRFSRRHTRGSTVNLYTNIAMCPTARSCVTLIPIITSDVTRPN